MQPAAPAEIRRIVQECRTISTLPTIFHKVNEAVDNPTSSASDLASIISTDQGLTTRLLTLVNSSFYSFSKKIDTVSRAVTIIGFKQLKELVLATSVLSMFKDVNSESGLNMEDFWKHSIACGLACRILAIYRRDENPEAYFVAGLLHDIGRLVLLESRGSRFAPVLAAAKGDSRLLFEAEQKTFGFSHADVGAALMAFWKLPQHLHDAVSRHHAPGRGKQQQNAAGVVHIADILVHAAGIGSSGEFFVPPLQPEIWQSSRLQKSMLEPVMDKIQDQFDDAYRFIMGCNGK